MPINPLSDRAFERAAREIRSWQEFLLRRPDIPPQHLANAALNRRYPEPRRVFGPLVYPSETLRGVIDLGLTGAYQLWEQFRDRLAALGRAAADRASRTMTYGEEDRALATAWRIVRAATAAGVLVESQGVAGATTIDAGYAARRARVQEQLDVFNGVPGVLGGPLPPPWIPSGPSLDMLAGSIPIEVIGVNIPGLKLPGPTYVGGPIPSRG